MNSRNLIAAFGLVILAIAPGSCAQNGATPPSENALQTHVTNAGHKYTYHYMPDAKRTAIAMAWLGGYSGLPVGKENIRYFGPRLMTDGGAGGTRAADIVAEFEALDAGARLYSETNSIRGFIVAPVADLPEVADIVNRVLAKPDLDSRWLKRFKSESIEQQNEIRTTVGGQAWITLRNVIMNGHRLEQAWSWHPLENVDTIEIEDVKKWYRDSISTGDLAIAVAGKATAEQASVAIDTALAGLPAEHNRKNFEPLNLTFSGKTILVHQPDADKSFVLIAGQLPGLQHPDDLAHSLGVGVLGQSGDSRLYKTVRNEQRASYLFGASKRTFTRANEVLAINGEVETEKLPVVLAAVQRSYEEFIADGIGALEFPIARRIMVKQTREHTAKPETIAYLMTEEQIISGDEVRALTLLSRASALKRAEVNTAIKNNFPDWPEMTKIIVTPDRDAIKADCIIDSFLQASQCS